MDISIIILLLVFIVIAVIEYYYGWYRHSEALNPGIHKGGFLSLTILIIPALLILLWLQSGAEKRLAATGFTPHPAISSVSGIVVGIGKNPTWLFNAKGDNMNLDFYRDEKNRKGWELIEDGNIMLIFKSGEKKMIINSSNGWTTNIIAYTLQE